jgi:hypothetical protein
MGIILLVNGLVWLPGEELVIQHKQLVLSGRISNISLDELIAITIQTDKIILETNQPHKMIIQHFNIDRQTAISLQNYLSKHMEKYPNVIIKNNVN